MTQWPSITTGLGKLTPDLWHRLIKMLKWYESQQPDYRRAASVFSGSAGARPFLAKIRKAKCIAVNRYEYSWIQVYLKDDNTIANVPSGKSSTVDGDDFALAAINLIEIQNTTTRASAGVYMGPDYPLEYNLQLVGGGSGDVDEEITPDIDCIVLLHTISGTNIEKGAGTTSRYVFSNVNEHDGTCITTLLTVSDPSTEPDTTPDTAFIWVEGDEVHWKNEDGIEWTLDQTLD